MLFTGLTAFVQYMVFLITGLTALEQEAVLLRTTYENTERVTSN